MAEDEEQSFWELSAKHEAISSVREHTHSLLKHRETSNLLPIPSTIPKETGNKIDVLGLSELPYHGADNKPELIVSAKQAGRAGKVRRAWCLVGTPCPVWEFQVD